MAATVAERMRAYRKRRRARGLCSKCPALAREGRSLCAACAGAESAAQRERMSGRRECGICITCGRIPPAPGRVRCPDCMAAAQRAQQRYEMANKRALPPPMGFHRLQGLRRRLEAFLRQCRRCGGAMYQDVHGDILCRNCGVVLMYAAPAYQQDDGRGYAPDPDGGRGRPGRGCLRTGPPAAAGKELQGMPTDAAAGGVKPLTPVLKVIPACAAASRRR